MNLYILFFICLDAYKWLSFLIVDVPFDADTARKLLCVERHISVELCLGELLEPNKVYLDWNFMDLFSVIMKGWGLLVVCLHACFFQLNYQIFLSVGCVDWQSKQISTLNSGDGCLFEVQVFSSVYIFYIHCCSFCMSLPGFQLGSALPHFFPFAFFFLDLPSTKDLFLFYFYQVQSKLVSCIWGFHLKCFLKTCFTCQTHTQEIRCTYMSEGVHAFFW